jgi:hypothetical protein
VRKQYLRQILCKQGFESKVLSDVFVINPKFCPSKAINSCFDLSSKEYFDKQGNYSVKAKPVNLNILDLRIHKVLSQRKLFILSNI